MVSTLYDEERVSEQISAYGTEVVFRKCLNEVVLSGHVVTLWACAEQWEWVSEDLFTRKPPQYSTTTKEAVKLDDSDHTDSHVEHVHGNY